MLYLLLGILSILFLGLTILFFKLDYKYFRAPYIVLAIVCLIITITLVLVLFSFSMMLIAVNQELVAIETKLDIPNSALEGIIQETEEVAIVDYYANIKVYGKLSPYWPLNDKIMNIYNRIIGD